MHLIPGRFAGTGCWDAIFRTYEAIVSEIWRWDCVLVGPVEYIHVLGVCSAGAEECLQERRKDEDIYWDEV